MDPATIAGRIAIAQIIGIVLLKLVSMYLGYLIVCLGSGLIASGAKGEFKFKTSFSGIKADLTSISPGLLFVLLGVCLIGYSIAVKKTQVFRAEENGKVTAQGDFKLNPVLPESYSKDGTAK